MGRSKVSRATLLLAPVLSLAACGDSEPPPVLRHVLVISLDTTRADHLGCYGGRVATPRIDALAKGGVRFADVTSPAASTLAAHTSMMTGTWPNTHGVPRNGFSVDPGNEMLAEMLAAQGFHTGAVLGSFALASRFGFDQGFTFVDEKFEESVGEAGVDQNQRNAQRVTKVALAYVDRVKSDADRMFLFVHYFDAHAPYAPPSPHDAEYTENFEPAKSDLSDLESASSAQRERILQSLVVPEDAEPDPAAMVHAVGEPAELDQRLADLYAGEIAYIDTAIGALLDGLEQRGLLDETLVVLTGDHGETFWEHFDFWNHGLWVHQTTMHVPLVMRFPDARRAGSVVTEPVSTVDLVPTLCALLGLPRPMRCDGVDLGPLLAGQRLTRGTVFGVATQPWEVEVAGEWKGRQKAMCAREGPWKYVRARYNKVEQLFHLGDDPGENNDLLQGELDAEATLARDRLRAALDRWEEGGNPLPSKSMRRQGSETDRRLEGLGYADGHKDEDEER